MSGEQKEGKGGETRRRNMVGPSQNRNGGVSSSKALSLLRTWGRGHWKCSPLVLLLCASILHSSSYQFNTVLCPTFHTNECWLVEARPLVPWWQGLEGTHFSVKSQRLRWTIEKHWGHTVWEEYLKVSKLFQVAWPFIGHSFFLMCIGEKFTTDNNVTLCRLLFKTLEKCMNNGNAGIKAWIIACLLAGFAASIASKSTEL